MSITLDPLQLPSVPLGDRKQLPTCPAIYFAIDSQNRILYVGKAKDLSARWKNHHRLYKLETIDHEFPVRLAWQPWDTTSLDEAEKRLILTLQPLLNNTEVETPEVIPAEVVLREFLKRFSRRLIILGVEDATSDRLLNVHLRYDPTNYSAKGTAAQIKAFIEQNREKNTSLRFKRHKWYSDFSSFTIETLRPGSRAQRTMARQYRAFNHWECACNGVIIHIMPTDCYRTYRTQSEMVKLAGVNCRAVTQALFSEAQRKNSPEVSRLSSFIADPVPLLWTKL